MGVTRRDCDMVSDGLTFILLVLCVGVLYHLGCVVFAPAITPTACRQQCIEAHAKTWFYNTGGCICEGEARE